MKKNELYRAYSAGFIQGLRTLQGYVPFEIQRRKGFFDNPSKIDTNILNEFEAYYKGKIEASNE